MRDDLGLVEFPLADLSGRLLAHCMMVGLATLLKVSQVCPRSYWLALKAGYLPPCRGGQRRRLEAEAAAPPKPLKPLGLGRMALIEAMLAYPQCQLTRQEVELVVRQMRRQEVSLWLMEPDVKMHYRELTGKPTLKLAALVSDDGSRPTSHYLPVKLPPKPV